MEIVCKYCKYEYDFARYGETCPNCHMENIPFRSQSARKMMGYQTDSLHDRYFGNAHEARRAAMDRSGDPLHGKSSLRRIRPYVFMLVLVFAIAMLGHGMLRLSRMRETPNIVMEKPPISELASAAVGKSFYSSGGVTFLALHVGVVAPEMFEKPQPDTLQCIFVNVRANVKKGQEKTQLGKLYIRVNGKLYLPEMPNEDSADLWQYTPLELDEMWEYGTTSGQVFFYIPKEVKKFDFCWMPASGEQMLPISL